MIAKGYNEIKHAIEYRYGILSQLISEIDKLLPKNVCPVSKRSIGFC